MSEKKLFNKKWLIAISVIVLIAIIATMLIVFLPKDANKLIDRIYASEKAVFLESSEEKDLYNDFKDKLIIEPSYKTEAIYTQTLCESLHQMVSFYTTSLHYAENNNTFQSNYKKIMNGMDKVEDYKNNLISILKEVENKIEGSAVSNLRTAWRDFRKSYVEYLKSYSHVIEGLNDIYQNCFPKGLKQNLFTYEILNSVDSFLDYIIEDYEYMVKVDIRDNVTANKFLGGKKIDKLSNFIEVYLEDQNFLTSYNFSSSLQNDMKSIEKFKEVYDSNVSAVIKSIKNDYQFANSEKDKQNLLNTVKKFIDGGCKV